VLREQATLGSLELPLKTRLAPCDAANERDNHADLYARVAEILEQARAAR
jgi:hypothetical protein